MFYMEFPHCHACARKACVSLCSPIQLSVCVGLNSCTLKKRVNVFFHEIMFGHFQFKSY